MSFNINLNHFIIDLVVQNKNDLKSFNELINIIFMYNFKI